MKNYFLHACFLTKYFVLSQHFVQFLEFSSVLYLMFLVYCQWIPHPLYELSRFPLIFLAQQFPKCFVDFDVILCCGWMICCLWILVPLSGRTTVHLSVNFVAQWTLCRFVHFDILHCWGLVLYCPHTPDPESGRITDLLSLNVVVQWMLQYLMAFVLFLCMVWKVVRFHP